ncbi:MAG: hypothetical protein HY509_03440 [Acidobacteria bacterium]|nr:hypothetical protein [Acidobacteriota bacterium]
MAIQRFRPWHLRLGVPILFAALVATPAAGHRGGPSGPDPPADEEFSPLFPLRLEASLADLDREEPGHFFGGLTEGRMLLADGSVETPLSWGVSMCLLSACLTSICTQSGCLGSLCEASGCLGSLCIVSGCLSTSCGASLCLFSGCLASACVASDCLASSCSNSTCEAKCGKARQFIDDYS